MSENPQQIAPIPPAIAQNPQQIKRRKTGARRHLRKQKGPGRGNGRIPVSPDAVRDVAAKMYTIAGMAAALGISHDTLESRLKEPEYAAAYEAGRAEGCNKLASLQIKAAEKLNPALLIWLGKQHMGQRDIVENQVSGAGGGPMQIEIVRVVVDRTNNREIEE